MDARGATASGQVSSQARAPNVAAGVAVFAALMVSWATARELWLLRPVARGARLGPACARPVEVRGAGAVRLGCAGEAELAACRSMEAGDAVLVGEAAERAGRPCIRVASGMSAPMRLLVGLPLDVNRASAAELALLEELGPSVARAIVAHRDRCGHFSDIAELARVRGVGRTRAERLARRLVFGAGAPTSVAAPAHVLERPVDLGECRERE